MPPQTAPLANDLGIFLMQCPKNSLISAWPPEDRGERLLWLQDLTERPRLAHDYR
jgi:hypothetical protein